MVNQWINITVTYARTDLPQWNLYDPEMSPCAQLLQLNTPALTLLQRHYLCKHQLQLFETMVACCKVAPWGHFHFEFHASKFLHCKPHISPVQISFLQCKSHISPVQISGFSSANLEKCEICTGEMRDLHWRNERFVQEKCEICTGEMWDLYRRNVRFVQEKCEVCTGEM